MDFQEDIKEFYDSHRIAHIAVGEADFRYVLCGPEDAEHTLMYLVGGLGMFEAWLKHIEIMEKDYRILAFDLPMNAMTNEETVDSMEAFLKELGFSRVVVIGSSLGGFIGQMFARKYPKRVEKLVLYSTSGLTKNSIEGLKKQYRYMGVTSTLEKVLPYKWMNRFFLGIMKKMISKEATEEERKYLSELFEWCMDTTRYTREFSSHIESLQFDLINTVPIMKDNLEYLDGKVLLILPEDDTQFTDAMKKELVDTMTNPVILEMKGGHVATLMKVEEYTEVTRKFIEM